MPSVSTLKAANVQGARHACANPKICNIKVNFEKHQNPLLFSENSHVHILAHYISNISTKFSSLLFICEIAHQNNRMQAQLYICFLLSGSSSCHAQTVTWSILMLD